MSSGSIADRSLAALVGADAWPAPSTAADGAHDEWQHADEVLARHCELHLSGTLYIDGEPPVRVYLHRGLVYFAERTTDTELGLRLVLDGVITDEQLARGSRLLEGGRHLGPMFENDPTIDRRWVLDAVVGYCTEALASLPGRLVASPVFTPDAHHSSGILAWYCGSGAPTGEVPAHAERVVAESVVPALTAAGLPRRSRTASVAVGSRLADAEISALRSAVMTMRAVLPVGATGRTEPRSTPATLPAASAGPDAMPGSSAARRRRLIRRHR